MIEVELPDGRILEFPEGTSQDVMRGAIQNLLTSEASPTQEAPAPAQAPPMIERQLPDGTFVDFPPGTPEDEINAALDSFGAPAETPVQAPPSGPAANPAAPVEPGFWRDFLSSTLPDIANSSADGFRQGVAAIAGAPVEIVNASPMLLNLLPGEQGATPFSDRPRGGFEDSDWLLRAAGLIDDYEPQTTPGRFANRVGEELGATAVPLAGSAAVARRIGVQGARQLNPVARSFVEPMAVAPQRVGGREAAFATASGLGAQGANELVDPADGEGEWWSDLLGSVGGLLAYGTGNAVAGFARNAVGAATGNTRAFDDVAGSAVTDRLINNSSAMQTRHAEGGDRIMDATQLADALSRPSPAEQAIPGFRANIGDRAQDPGLSTLAYNTDAALPGAANARRAGNAAVVDQRLSDAAPTGNAAALRQSVARGAEGRIAGAEAARQAAERAASDADASLAVPSAVERGNAIRSGLSDRLETERSAVSEMFGQIDDDVPLDATLLEQAIQRVTNQLPLNDQARFVPNEAATVARLAREQGPASNVGEALSIRSGLASDIRAPATTHQQRRVTGQYLDEVDGFISQALPEDQRALLSAAKDRRLDVGRRFEDRGAVPDILRQTGRSQFRLPDEAVPARAIRGETDYRSIMAEVGTDAAARRALGETIVADAQRTNALRSPEALTQFMQDRNFALQDFPEARAALERAGVSRQALTAAERTAKETARDFAPGGSSAAGQYLRYDDTQTRAAIGTAWKSAQPGRAVRELLEVAGDTPETRASARAALWEEVSGSGQLDAPTSTPADGVQRWSGRKLQKLFSDPRFKAAANILWEDNPEHLADLENVVSALSKADGSTNARAPATSGTAQSLNGSFDPSMTTTSIASRLRSVSRGQLSPTIAVVDVLSTFLRNRSAKVQGRAIDELMSKAVNDPDLAAALLRRYNPADEAAENRAFLTRFGVRLPTVANILAGDASDEDDPFIALQSVE